MVYRKLWFTFKIYLMCSAFEKAAVQRTAVVGRRLRRTSLCGKIQSQICSVPQEFPCQDDAGTCVHQRLWCDGRADCPNGADEAEEICKHNSGMYWHFHSQVGTTLPPYKPEECILSDFPSGCTCAYGSAIQCYNAQLTSVPQNILPTGSLTSLNLSSNSITQLPDGIFEKYPNLTQIEISHGSIRHVGAEAFTGLKRLKRIWLHNNRISVLFPKTFARVPRLRLLDLSFNQLVDWSPEVFLGKHSLQWIDVRHNRLKLEHPDMLKYLGPSCSYLEFDHNNITKLTSSTFHGAEGAVTLSLADNRVSSIAPDTFSRLNLSELNLGSNDIRSLDARLFAGQVKLHELNLSSNPVQYLPQDLFHGLHQLANLYLEHMEVRNLNRKMFGDPNMTIEHIRFAKLHYCGYAPSVMDCFPKTDGISSTENLLDSLVLKISCWLIGTLALFFSGFVIGLRLYLWKGSSQLSKVYSVSILSLALSDSVMGIYILIIAGVDLVYKDEYYKYSHKWVNSSMCRFSGCLAVISSEVSTLLLVFMATERYARLVWKPFGISGTTLRTTVLWILACWFVGLATGLVPLVLDFADDEMQLFYSQNGACLPMFTHDPFLKRWWMSAIIFIVTPLIGMIFTCLCYSAICLHVEHSRQESERSRADRSHLQKVLAITISNNLSWIVIIVIKLLALMGVQIPPGIYGWMAVFVLPVNCCLNPIIYTVMSPDFKGLMRTLSSRQSRSRAEAKALQQIVYYTAGMNSLSRQSTLRRGERGSSATVTSRLPLSHQNSFGNVSRQGSVMSPVFAGRIQKSRPPKCVLPKIPGSHPATDGLLENSEDEGIVMTCLVAKPSVASALEQYDC